MVQYASSFVGGFTALGGSNTLGAKHSVPGKGGMGAWTSFARLTYEKLHEANLTDAYHNGGIGAMGPTLAAACVGKFFPMDTRYATIEYLPNSARTPASQHQQCARSPPPT